MTNQHPAPTSRSPDDEDERMSLTDVARRLNVAYSTAAKWAASGEIPAHPYWRPSKASGYYVLRSELETWIESDDSEEFVQIRPRRRDSVPREER